MKKVYLPFIILIIISIAALFIADTNTIPAANTTKIDTADTAWLLTASALVLLMTPGLAFFYGGLVDNKNVISTMLQSIIAMGVVSIVWVILGFSLAFGDSMGGIIGNPTTFFMFRNTLNAPPWSLAPTIPLLLYACFQLKFAIITPALITGAFADRIKFTSYILFIVLFTVFIYAPLAHWTWHPNGFLLKLGVIDFAGGSVVHVSAGAAALAAAWYLKAHTPRHERQPHAPANIPYIIIGTGLLWFGWFGFNAGSAFGANLTSVLAFANTNTAAAASALAWIFFDVTKGKKVTAVGACIGIVVGLVAITPAAGFVGVPTSIFIGTFTSVFCNWFLSLFSKTNLDDTLDVFPCHGVGGMVGMLLTGIFASHQINETIPDGLFFGNYTLLIKQLIGLVIVFAFVFFASLLLLKIVDLIHPLRVTAAQAAEGLDISQHGESVSRSKMKELTALQNQ